MTLTEVQLRGRRRYIWLVSISVALGDYHSNARPGARTATSFSTLARLIVLKSLEKSRNIN